ncbi:hypothetical protein ACVWXN_008564 [Bradyrhizobium sp. i1.4.4]
MVQRAKELGTDRLMFFERIDQAADWLGTVDLIHSNGTIQYVPDALETVRTLCSVRPAMLAWYRVPISEETRREVQTSYLSDNGPGSSLASKEKLVRYERNWISEQAFIQAHEGFRITERSPDPHRARHATIQVRAGLACDNTGAMCLTSLQTGYVRRPFSRRLSTSRARRYRSPR